MNDKSKITKGPYKRFEKQKKIDKKILVNKIIKFNEANRNLWYASNITTYAGNQLRCNYTVQLVRNFMKCEFNFTYKRIKSKSNNID